MTKSGMPSSPSSAGSQRELFQLDSPMTGKIRGERSLMAFPFFALSKNACMKPLAYATGDVTIQVRPSARGVATIYERKLSFILRAL